MTEPTPTRIDSLQVLRFVAALLVVIGHSQHEFAAMPSSAIGRYGFIPFDWGLGVDIFFVISCFVVTGSMAGRSFGSLKELLLFFYARRLMRIMPAW